MEEDIKKDIINDIKETAAAINGYLSFNKYEEEGRYGHAAVRKFGSWSDAKEAAGLPTAPPGKVKINAEEIAEKIEAGMTFKEVAEELDITYSYVHRLLNDAGYRKRRVLKPKNYENYSDPVIMVTFMAEMLQKAGYDPEEPVPYELEADKENGKIIFNLQDERLREETR